MNTKIYVGNLNYSTTDEDLRNFFMEAGNISDIAIPQDRETGRARGFAFITFETQESAQNAATFNGKELMGRTLKVNMAKERDSRSGGGGGRGRSAW